MIGNFIRSNKILCLLTLAAFLVAGVAYSFLPGQIPMQWNQLDVVWSADRLAIFTLPLLCALVLVVLKPLFSMSVAKHFSLFTRLPDIICGGTIGIFITSEIYTIAYCYGFRLRIDAVLLVEILAWAIWILCYLVKSVGVSRIK